MLIEVILHPLNALSPIYLMLSGITIEDNCEQLLNALAAILVTVLGIV